MKALAIDIDGTITDDKRRINCRAIEVIRSLKVPVILATGNTVCFALTTAKLIGTDGIVIAENGGVVKVGYDAKECVLCDGTECEKAFELLSKHFDLEKLDAEYRKTDVALRRNFDLSMAREMSSKSGLNVDLVDSGFAVHIKNKHINKGIGLKKVAELLGLSTQDTVAIGDSENDIEMFNVAGFKVAVGNADPRLKQMASLVTKGKYGAGVAEAIETIEGSFL
ncbi:MAG: phosphoglycolate phosphatase [Methanosarcinales archaeon]|nr:MAG: phosphoglycolate phosphatase [Methanosarcinales archaeon]